MTIKFKKLSDDAVVPRAATDGSAGVDLVATRIIANGEHGTWYETDLAVEIPSGYVGLVFPRSSISKLPLSLANSVGVIDSDYRGSIQVRFRAHTTESPAPIFYQPGDRVAQLVIVPCVSIQPEETDELSHTERGAGGFGSTGK